MLNKILMNLEESVENLCDKHLNNSYRSRLNCAENQVNVTRMRAVKDIQSLQEDIDTQSKENQSLSDKNKILIGSIEQLKNEIKDLSKVNAELLESKTKIETELKKIQFSNGGFKGSNKNLIKKNEQLEKENTNIKRLLQKVVRESGRKLTPPTIQELKNYDLFRNRKGKKKNEK